MLFGVKLQGQSIDDIFFTAKMNVIDYNTYVFSEKTTSKLSLILSDSRYCEADTLSNKGFRDVLFIKVRFADGNFEQLIEQIENDGKLSDEGIGEVYAFDFVLAYSYQRNRFYKLKGFVYNEFDLFYSHYILSSSNIERQKIKDDWLEHYFVEGLDINCLYSSMKRKKKPLDKYPCLRPSETRLLYVNGVPFVK
jgi:hypothetical protein